MIQITSPPSPALVNSFKAIDAHKVAVSDVLARVREGSLTAREALVEFRTTIASSQFTAGEATRQYFMSRRR